MAAVKILPPFLRLQGRVTGAAAKVGEVIFAPSTIYQAIYFILNEELINCKYDSEKQETVNK